MEYGIPWTPDPADEKDLIPCPFQLFFNQDVWQLCKRRCITILGKKVNFIYRIHEYTSVSELLFDLLLDKRWFCTMSPSAKGRIEEDIHQIYFLESNYSKGFTYKQKFKLIQQFTRREVRGSKVISAPILSELCETAFSLNVPAPTSYAEALTLAKKTKFKLPENDILEFDNSDELAAWVLAYLVDHDKTIGRCKKCNKYYIKSHKNSKYCGLDCSNNRNTTGACLGEREILLRYKCIDQWFNRKQESKSEYIYSDGGEYIGAYNSLELFSGLKGTEASAPPSARSFSANDFSAIKETYREAYHDRYSRLKKAKEACDCKRISNKEYQDMLDSFLLWLDNVRTQLNYFSRF